MQCSEVLRVHTSAVHCFQVWVQSKELAAVRRTVLGKGLPRYTGNCAVCTGKLCALYCVHSNVSTVTCTGLACS